MLETWVTRDILWGQLLYSIDPPDRKLIFKKIYRKEISEWLNHHHEMIVLQWHSNQIFMLLQHANLPLSQLRLHVGMPTIGMLYFTFST